MKPDEAVARLAEIDERLDVIAEARLLAAERPQLETEIAAERPSPELKRLLDWVDGDSKPLLRKVRRALRGP